MMQIISTLYDWGYGRNIYEVKAKASSPTITYGNFGPLFEIDFAFGNFN